MPSRRTLTLRRSAGLTTLGLAALATLAACGDDSTGLIGSEFLRGTTADPDVGVVLSTLSSSLTLFHAGAPRGDRVTISIASGSTAPTPVGFVVRGTRAAVPLGRAASVAVLDLRGASSTTTPRYFTFPSGDATGAAWVDDNTILAANLVGDYVGKIDLRQSATTITQTVAVTPAPTAIVVSGSLAYVVSGNLSDNFASLGNGVVSEVDPRTMTVKRTVTVGPNPTAAALGPDGKLYVVNTNDYTAPGNLSVVDLATMQVERTVPGFGAGPGAITIGDDGRAYVSSLAFGTLVWDTRTSAFVRGTSNPVCARDNAASGAPCRGASDADLGSDGRLYQTFFGGTGLPPRVFVFTPGTYQLTDSVDVGPGPYDVDVRSYR